MPTAHHSQKQKPRAYREAEGRKRGLLVSVLLTCPTPASWHKCQRVSHPERRGGSAF